MLHHYGQSKLGGMQIDVIKGKTGENRLVITLNGKVCNFFHVASLLFVFSACGCFAASVLTLLPGCAVSSSCGASVRRQHSQVTQISFCVQRNI